MLEPDALILCGGAGSRLGGVDKPLQLLAGRPLIDHVLTRIAPQAASLFISANRNRAQYAARQWPVIDDGPYADAGPLAGVLAGLAVAQTDFVLIAPGDAPLLPDDLAARLQQTRALANADIVYALDGSGPQPLVALIRRSLQDDLRTHLIDGGRTPRDWYRRHRCAQADFSHWPSWAWSVNTPTEWQQAEATLAALKL